jgi:hypothetical protein
MRLLRLISEKVREVLFEEKRQESTAFKMVTHPPTPHALTSQSLKRGGGGWWVVAIDRPTDRLHHTVISWLPRE